MNVAARLIAMVAAVAAVKDRNERHITGSRGSVSMLADTKAP